MMTRSHKYNDKDHASAAVPQERVPRFFSKHGHPDADPKKTKKNGGGKHNWGGLADEIMNDESFHFTNARRRSNSNSFNHNVQDFRTKFETNDPEPVFDASIHGPLAEDELENSQDENVHESENRLTKIETTSTSASTDEAPKSA